LKNKVQVNATEIKNLNTKCTEGCIVKIHQEKYWQKRISPIIMKLENLIFGIIKD